MSENPKDIGLLPAAEAPVCESVCEKLMDSALPDAPSGEPEPVGPKAVREPEATNPAASAATPDVGHPGAPLPAVCARCGVEVPEGVGRCPGCGTFQKDNVESVVHGLRSKKLAKIVDAYRVDLIEQLFAERGGRDALDVVSRIAIENYALVCAQHKTIEARLDQDGLFTQTGRRRSAFDMLKGISETIDRLRAELPPPLSRSGDRDATDQMPTSALEMARDLLKRQIAGETLSDRELGALDVLRGAMRGEVRLPDPVNVPVFDAVRDAGPRVQAEAEPHGVTPAPTVAPAPAPGTDARCPTCGAPAGQCATIRNEPRWLAEHRERPDVVAHLERQRQTRIRWGHETADGGGILRDGGITCGPSPEDDPTAEMLESMRRARKGDIPQW